MTRQESKTSRKSMPVMRTLVFPALLLSLWMCGMQARAQQDVGYIVGNVTDQNNAIVPGAKVHITNRNNGLSVDVKADGNGNYQSGRLQVGTYAVRISAPGFATWTVNNVVVDVAVQVTENAVLQVGSETTTISVKAIAPALDTTDATVGGTIDDRAAQQFPINGRSVLALATLSPGVESGIGPVSEGFTNRGTSVASIRISGGVMGANNNLLDGVTNVTTFTGEIGMNIKSDGVQEYRIMTGVIPAQFGYTSGGVINVVTRGGGDKYHGSAYEFLRNSAFDAEVAFPRPTFGKPPLHFNDFGGTLGGPIPRVKNLFGFVNYEQFHYTTVSASYASVPTDQEYTGDFSDLGHLSNGVCVPTAIYDATTASTTGTRTQFSYNGVANVIPPSRLDPAALAYQKMFYPKANNSSGSYNSCTHANNYIETPEQITNERTILGRVDYRQSANDSWVARYGFYANSQNNAQGYSPAYNRNDHDQTQNALLAETHVLSPTLVNEIRFGLERTDFPFMSAQQGKNNAATIGLPAVVSSNASTATQVAQGALQISNGLSEPYGTAGFRSNTIGELIDDATLIRGKHTITVGAAVRFTETYNYQSNGGVAFSFSSVTTAAGNDTTTTSGTGSTYASYLLGEVHSASATPVAGEAWRRMMYAGYVQDDWRPLPRLTVNAGLRYDYMANATAKQDFFTNVDLNKPNGSNPALMGLVEYAGRDGVGRDFAHENHNDWGPRLGFAYQLTPDGKTVLRGGVAIYYAATTGMEYAQSNGSQNGFGSLTTSYSATTGNGVLSQFQNGMPGTIAPVAGYALGQTAFLGQSVATINPSAKDPSSQQYTLTVSRELPRQWVLDVTYIGNAGRHFITYYGTNLNFLNPKYYSLGTAYLNAQSANPYAGMVPGSLGAAKLTNATLLKPYPYYSSIGSSYTRGGSFDGNYMYVSLQRRIPHGLAVMGSFTYGKLMDLPIFTDLSICPGGGSSTSNGPQNPYNMKADWSVDTFDVSKRVSASVLYDLPFGRGEKFLNSNRLVNAIVGGWQYNVIAVVESGRPLLISGASNQGIASRPNFNPGVKVRLAHPTIKEWFNTQAFIDPPDYSFGNVPRCYSPVRGPHKTNFDMSVFRKVPINDRMNLELRVEGFNATNHTRLANPNTSFTAGSPADPSNPYAEGGTNTNSTFGTITGVGDPRNIQLAAKITF